MSLSNNNTFAVCTKNWVKNLKKDIKEDHKEWKQKKN